MNVAFPYCLKAPVTPSRLKKLFRVTASQQMLFQKWASRSNGYNRREALTCTRINMYPYQKPWHSRSTGTFGKVTLPTPTLPASLTHDATSNTCISCLSHACDFVDGHDWQGDLLSLLSCFGAVEKVKMFSGQVKSQTGRGN